MEKTVLIRKQPLSEQRTLTDYPIVIPAAARRASLAFQAIVGTHFKRAGYYMEQGRLDRAVECLEDARYLAMTMIKYPEKVTA